LLRPVAGALADENVVAVAAGNHFSIARTVFGELLGWGLNDQGQLRTGKHLDLFTPTAVKDPEGTHCEQIAAGFNFTLALEFPGLLGDAKSRAAAKSVFSKWRKKALGSHAAGKATGVTALSLDDILRQAARSAGLEDLLECGSSGGVLTVSDLLSQLQRDTTEP
jgi:hypothetical protein